MNKCQKCGTEFEGKFCPECGTAFTRTCPVCGATVKPNAKFCSECGTKVDLSGGTETLAVSVERPLPATDNAAATTTGVAPSENRPTPAITPAAATTEKTFTHETSAPQSEAAASHLGGAAKKPEYPFERPASYGLKPSSPLPAAQLSYEEQKIRRKMTIVGAIPFVVCLLFSIAIPLLGFAPVANVNDIIFGSGSKSYGNLYEISLSSFNPVRFMVFFVCGFGIFAGAMGLSVIFLRSKIKYLANHAYKNKAILSLYFMVHALWVLALIVAILTCYEINKTEYAEIGAVSPGAWPICTIIFSVLTGLICVAAQVYKFILDRKYPELTAKIKEEIIEETKPKKPNAKTIDKTADIQKDVMLSRIRSTLRLKKLQPAFVLYLLITMNLNIFSRFFVSTNSIGLFSLLLIVVNLTPVIIYIISICKKTQELRENSSIPEAFFVDNLYNVGCYCVFGIILLAFFIFATAALFLFPSSTFSTVISLFIFPWAKINDLVFELPSKTVLQVEGVTAYIMDVASLVVLIVILLSLTFLVVMEVINMISVKKMSAALNENSFSEYNNDRMKLQSDIAKAPIPKHTKIIKRAVLLSVAGCIAAAGVIAGINVGTNNFSPLKLNRIAIGATQIDVQETLGEAYMQGGNEWDYFSDNFVDLREELQSIERQAQKALLSGDFSKLEKLEQQSEKLEEAAKNMKFAALRVMFGVDKCVTRIEMFSGDRPSSCEMNAVLSTNRIPLTYITNGDIFNGDVNIYYTATYGNTYVRAELGAEVLAGITETGTHTLE